MSIQGSTEYGRIYGQKFSVVPEWVIKAGSARAVHLWSVLQLYANKKGQCFPGRKTIARDMGCSLSTVDRAVDDLCAIGALLVEPRMAPDGDRTSNDYYLITGSDLTPPQD